VEVVEADQGAQLELGVHAAAHRHGDHRVGPGLRQRGDVRTVGDVVREADMPLAVPRDVQDIRAGEAPARDERFSPLRGDRLDRPALEARKRVGARSP
jgi:hypothetical protein